MLISLLLKLNQPIPLKFKKYLHITALHLITFYYWETLTCHFLHKNMKTCLIAMFHFISLKTQHASIAQTPHVLITSILTKRQCFLIHLLSEQTFFDHHSLICTMFCSTFCKGPAKFIYYRSYNNYN